MDPIVNGPGGPCSIIEYVPLYGVWTGDNLSDNIMQFVHCNLNIVTMISMNFVKQSINCLFIFTIFYIKRLVVINCLCYMLLHV